MGFKPYNGVPNAVFESMRAMTVQSYAEGNVKLGTQWELGLYDAAFAGAAEKDTILITGSMPLLVKGRALRFDGLGFFTSVFETPTYTGGTPEVFYNVNHRNQATPEVQFLGGASVTVDGTKIATDKYFLGSTAAGNNVTSHEGFEAAGLEFLFAPNTTYLLRTTSIDVDPQRLFSYTTWYEGDTDFPLV